MAIVTAIVDYDTDTGMVSYDGYGDGIVFSGGYYNTGICKDGVFYTTGILDGLGVYHQDGILEYYDFTYHQEGIYSTSFSWADLSNALPAQGGSFVGISEAGGATYGSGILDSSGVYYAYGLYSLTGPTYLAEGVVYNSGNDYAGLPYYPQAGEVLSGIPFGLLGELTGTFAYPDSSQVEPGIGFGADGSQFTGSMNVVQYIGAGNVWDQQGGGGTLVLPDAANVLLGSSSFGPDQSLNGTLDPIVFLGGGDYALTTASMAVDGVPGNIDPATVMASNAQGTLPVDAVLLSAGGNYYEPDPNTVLQLGSAQYGPGGNTLNGNWVRPNPAFVKISEVYGTGEVGSYNPIPAAVAAQLASDIAAITAGQADIKTTRTILTVTGTLNLTNLTAGNVKNGVVIGGVTGTLLNEFTLVYDVGTGEQEIELDARTDVDLVFNAVDGNGDPINLDGRTITFTVFRDFPNNPVTMYSKTGAITSSGNDVVTVTLSANDTIPLRCRYQLTTDNDVELAAGLYYCH